MAGHGEEVGLGLERHFKLAVDLGQNRVGSPNFVPAPPDRHQSCPGYDDQNKRCRQQALHDNGLLLCDFEIPLELALLELRNPGLLVGRIELRAEQLRTRGRNQVTCFAIEPLEGQDVRQGLGRLLVSGVEIGRELVELPVSQISLIKVGILEQALYERYGEAIIAALCCNCGLNAVNEGKPVAGLSFCTKAFGLQSVISSLIEFAELDLDKGQIGEDAHLEQRAFEFAGIYQGGAKGLFSFRTPAKIAIGFPAIIIRCQLEARVILINFLSFFSIGDFAFVIACLAVDRADIMQRNRLSTLIAELFVDLVCFQIETQRIRGLAVNGSDCPLGTHQIAMELRAWRCDRHQGQRFINLPGSIAQPVQSDIGFDPQPERCGFRHPPLVFRKLFGLSQRTINDRQRLLRVAHHCGFCRFY
nr:hypothetical protein [Porphyrobacter sp. ULC335]